MGSKAKRRAHKTCIVWGCTSDSRDDRTLEFVPFPKACFPMRRFLISNEQAHISMCDFCKKCSMWMDRCKRRRGFDHVRSINKSSFVCGKHFDEDPFDQNACPLTIEEDLETVEVLNETSADPEESAEQPPLVILEDSARQECTQPEFNRIEVQKKHQQNRQVQTDISYTSLKHTLRENIRLKKEIKFLRFTLEMVKNVKRKKRNHVERQLNGVNGK